MSVEDKPGLSAPPKGGQEQDRFILEVTHTQRLQWDLHLHVADRYVRWPSTSNIKPPSAKPVWANFLVSMRMVQTRSVRGSQAAAKEGSGMSVEDKPGLSAPPKGGQEQDRFILE